MTPQGLLWALGTSLSQARRVGMRSNHSANHTSCKIVLRQDKTGLQERASVISRILPPKTLNDEDEQIFYFKLFNFSVNFPFGFLNNLPILPSWPFSGEFMNECCRPGSWNCESKMRLYFFLTRVCVFANRWHNEWCKCLFLASVYDKVTWGML